jgi:hypothetical protein
LFLKQNRKCSISGESILFSKWLHKKGERPTASLDRIDSTKGYIEGNVQWVHKDINMMKSNHTTKKFFNWCKKVCLHNNFLCEKPFEQVSNT